MKQVGSILGFCLLFSSVLPVCLSAQSPDTVRLLQTVEISAAPIRQQTTGERQEFWQTDNLQNHTSNNLGELLSMQSGVFVKSYGLGSSATTSIRGGSAGHTQVIWNGLPVQNPMLGQLDFSLIPVGFVDKMTIAFGGNTATWGSGAIGGTVFLENEVVDKQGFTIKSRSELGSFGWWDQQVKFQY
ncbi:MAG: Plug domain-containing protein, partial [Saprospiraceae bacterium]